MYVGKKQRSYKYELVLSKCVYSIPVIIILCVYTKIENYNKNSSLFSIAYIEAHY